MTAVEANCVGPTTPVPIVVVIAPVPEPDTSPDMVIVWSPVFVPDDVPECVPDMVASPESVSVRAASPVVIVNTLSALRSEPGVMERPCEALVSFTFRPVLFR